MPGKAGATGDTSTVDAYREAARMVTGSAQQFKGLLRPL
jgi:hypothetical protein